MKLAGQYEFEAPLQTVWEALFDPVVLAATLPGCDGLERNGDRFEGAIKVKMGPVQGKFQGKVDIEDVVERESYSMLVDGRGPAGFGKANAKLKLREEGTSTVLVYESDVQVGGRIASVGQRLLDASSKAIVKQSLESLHQQIRARAALAAESDAAVNASEARPDGPEQVAPTAASGGAGGEEKEVAGAAAGQSLPERLEPSAQHAQKPANPLPPAAAMQGPSQAAFAMGVAKEMTRELLPVRKLVLIAVLLVFALVAYRVLWP